MEPKMTNLKVRIQPGQSLKLAREGLVIENPTNYPTTLVIKSPIKKTEERSDDQKAAHSK